MKKFYRGKDVPPEETPILNRIERRNTLLELANEIKSDQWHKMAVQTLSGSRRTQDSKPSTSSNSTFVVTDSDLASSWIYTSRRGVSNEVFNAHPENLELQEMGSCPTTFTVSQSNELYKTFCSCVVSTIIVLSILGILSTIAAIIYMETSSSRRISSVENNEFFKVSGFQHSEPIPVVANNYFSNVHESANSNTQNTFSEVTVTTESSESGIVLLHNDPYPGDYDELNYYANKTINALKNFFPSIKRSRVHNPDTHGGRNSRSHEKDSRRKGSPSLLQKITSFLFGAEDPNTFGGDLEETVAHTVHYGVSSTGLPLLLFPSKSQFDELGSGENEDFVETDISKMIERSTQVQVFPMENFKRSYDSLDFQDLLRKRLGRSDSEIAFTTQSEITIVPELQETNPPSLQEEMDHSRRMSNISVSIAQLLKIFKDIRRISSSVMISTSTEPPNDFRKHGSKDRGNSAYESNPGFDIEERNKYLQRLRNVLDPSGDF